jgi:hypothetical protein
MSGSQFGLVVTISYGDHDNRGPMLLSAAALQIGQMPIDC